MKWSILLCAAAVAVAAGALSKPHPQWSADKLNVHLVCHTHDDVGWLKTVDQYFMGSNNSIQHAGVRFILDSVTLALQANPERKFIYVEQAFFQRWWRQQSNETQALVKQLVSNGQLEFVNGAWSMHDEAAPTFHDMIDNTALGHAWIRREFGDAAAPKVTWQIDPFGHSATQAWLLSAYAGYEALYFGRIDYQDHALRYNESRLEFTWRASQALGADAQVFTGAYFTGNYGPPGGFCFDSFCADPPVQDDSRLEDYNVKERVDDFVAAAQELQKHTRGNDIMFMMGSDFQYENANEWYTNLDKLIEHVNADGRINVFYSTPSVYTRAKLAAGIDWTVKTDDFFPYADCPHCYWTGYFTSRPALKRYIRASSSLLNAARQLGALAGTDGSELEALWEALSVTQHHDSVSGTAKQHVTYDYARRLSRGGAGAEDLLNQQLSKLVDGGVEFSSCRLLNESSCAVTQQATTPVAVALYNPLGQARVEVVRLPVQGAGWSVVAPDGSAVEAETLPSHETESGRAPYHLVFQASLPPLGYAVYVASPPSRGTAARAPETVGASGATLENEHLRLDFDGSSGLLHAVTNKDTGVTVNVEQSFYWYNASSGYGQNSGAYIFRPNASTLFPVASGPVALSVDAASSASGVQQVRQVFADWVAQTVSLAPGERSARFEWTVGPVPIGDGMGKEVVATFKTNMDNADTFWTDSNGREMQERRVNYRPSWTLNVTEPVAGNFYPVNAAMFQRDSGTRHQLTVLNERSQAGTSLNATMQLMVHRRLLADDARGVGEPLNETQGITPYPNPVRIGEGLVIRGSHYLSLLPQDTAAATWRPDVDRLYHAPKVALAPLPSGATAAGWLKGASATGSALAAALPANVMLLTLQATGEAPGETIVRLAHQFGVGEDASLSHNATVDLTSLFAAHTVSDVVELSLTANRELESMLAEQALVGAAPLDAEDRLRRAREARFTGAVVLRPMEIRTFRVTLAATGVRGAAALRGGNAAAFA